MSVVVEQTPSIRIKGTTIKTYLASYVSAVRSFQSADSETPPLKYCCIEEFVLNNGQEFHLPPHPPKIKRGKMGDCYCNTWNLIGKDNRLTYVEGVGFNPHDIGCIHAWAVDPHGKVVDPTWPYHPDTTYMGIPFDWKFVNLTLGKSGHFGLLENSALPILRGEWQYKTASRLLK